MNTFLFKYLRPYRRLMQAYAALRYLEKGTSQGFELPVCGICRRTIDTAIYGEKVKARCLDHATGQLPWLELGDSN